MTKTATALRAEAAAHHAEAAESFARCDTDGFVSQWASGLNGQKASLEAVIAEAGGSYEFERTVLQTLTGEPVESVLVSTRYGTKHRIDATDEWLAYHPARESTLARKGYKEVTETAVKPATVIFAGGGRGLSGATNVRPIIIPVGAKKSEGWRPVGAPEGVSASA